MSQQQLPLIDLVINDESIVNDRGYNVLNSGLDRTRYDLNPICLYMHDLERSIGVCEQLRIEESKLIGSFRFDPDDPLSCEVHRKLSAGFLKGCSAGFFIKNMQMSDQHDTVDEWELVEVSIVTVPSNRGAVKLYHQDGTPVTDEASYLQQLKSNINMNTETPTHTERETLALSAPALEALGLTSGATIDDLSQAIVDLATQNKALRKTIDDAHQARREALLLDAIETGKITADQRQRYSDLYDTDPELCVSILADLSTRTSLADQLQHSKSAPSHTDRYDGTWDDLDRKGLLAELRAVDYETFCDKFRARFGTEYKPE